MITTTGALQPIHYRVSIPDPGAHEYHIEMRVPASDARVGAGAGTDGATATIVFPAWAPGSYMIRDFVRHVYGLRITDERGRPLAHQRLDKQSWRIDTGGAAFVVRYRVFAFEATVRTSFLDDSHAFWNGTNVFFAVEGEARRPCRLEVAAPSGWRVSTALPRARGNAGATDTTFAAADYDELVDAPVEVGTHQTFRFRVGGVAFEMALYGRTNADPRRLVDILRRVVRATGAIFGGFPFDRYLFIVHALPAGSGGLEHKASVTMDIAGLAFEDEKAYHRFADLAAHEFFHAWNVKRLHDPVLGPFDYGKENYTRLLWFHEGFTDYLANVIILRAGIIGEQDFRRWIAEDWPKYATRPGRGETPLDELSFEAWIKQYKPAENHFNNAVSYYEKGLWVGMALDLELRLTSARHQGLPEMFRWLWDRVGRREAPVTEADVRAAARAIAGRSLDAFFDKFIHGTDELPLPRLLRRAGLTVDAIPPWAAAANEGDGDPVRRARARGWSGAVVQGQVQPAGAERAVVKNVLPGSPAAAAGLTFGDEIVALDGDRVTGATFARRLADHPPGRRIAVSYFRRDRLRETFLVVAASPDRKLRIERAPRAGTAAAAVRTAWLGSPPPR
ncbi:MAG: PDZ domain-containing protein [Bacteroidota bacterium]